MGKRLIWAGLVMGLVGLVLGFVSSGECGSVFRPRDTSNDVVNRLFGDSPPDCSTALDLTTPVWILLGVGVVVLFAGALLRLRDQH